MRRCTAVFFSMMGAADHVLVGDEEAFAFCRALFDMTGISVGGSAGAVLVACVQYLREHPQLEQVACLCADRGENYSSTIFNDDWLKQQGLSVSFDRLEGLRDISLQASTLSKALSVEPKNQNSRTNHIESYSFRSGHPLPLQERGRSNLS